MARTRSAKCMKVIIVIAIITVFVAVKLLRDNFEFVQKVSSMTKVWPHLDASRGEKGEILDADNFAPRPSQKFFKIVHLDLKGAPPKMSYLLHLLDLIKISGGNGILIEYEDMFPFVGNLRNISSKMAYTINEIEKFIRKAEKLDMEMIPLVQTFGHLGYVLKLEEFKHLREVESFPLEICPSNEEAVKLIKEIIRQIMEVHNNSKYIHIGCDEVRNLGMCSVCSRMTAKKIFSHHVFRIASFVRATYQGVVPLIWDDMLRKWTNSDLENSALPSVVQPVVWVYSDNIPNLVPLYVWRTYFNWFPKLWGASAFKGASGETKMISNVSYYFENNLAWMRFMRNRKEIDNSPVEAFTGIILTGWSRYDHFAILCELLPVAIPSLVLNLILVNQNAPDKFSTSKAAAYDMSTFDRWLDLLHCPKTILPKPNTSVIGKSCYLSMLSGCEFPGHYFYNTVFQVANLKEKLNALSEKVYGGAYMSEYNMRNNFTNTWLINVLLYSEFKDNLPISLRLLKLSLRGAMAESFEEFVIQEWMEQNMDPIEKKLMRIREDMKLLLKRKVWPRRPLSRLDFID